MTTPNDRDPIEVAPAIPAAREAEAPQHDDDPDLLQAEIAATRADLAETMTELAARTDVKARAHDAVDNAKARVHDAVSSTVDRVKDAATTAADVVLGAGVATGQGVAAAVHKAKDAITPGTDDEPPEIDTAQPGR